MKIKLYFKMKMLIIIIFATFCTFLSQIEAQTISSGTIMGIHHQEILLDPDVTMNQFISFYKEKYIPTSEKAFPGMHIKLAKGIRGKHSDQLSVIYIFDSSSVREKYFKKDGDFTDAGLFALKKTESVAAELDKLGRMTYSYTDWMIL